MSEILSGFFENGDLVFSFKVKEDTDQDGNDVDSGPQGPELFGEEGDREKLK
jgi:hypothetical protein